MENSSTSVLARSAPGVARFDASLASADVQRALKRRPDVFGAAGLLLTFLPELLRRYAMQKTPTRLPAKTLDASKKTTD